MILPMSTPSTPTPLLPAVAAANSTPGCDPAAAEGGQDFAAVLSGMLPQTAPPGQPTAAGRTSPTPRVIPSGAATATSNDTADPILAVVVDATTLIAPGTSPLPAGKTIDSNENAAADPVLAAAVDATALSAPGTPPLPAGKTIGSDENVAADPADPAATPASPLFALFTPTARTLATTTASGGNAAVADARSATAAITPDARGASVPRPADATRTAADFTAKAKEAGQNLALRLNPGPTEAAAMTAPAATPLQPAEGALSALPAPAATLLQTAPAQAATPVVVDVPAPFGTRLWEQQIGQQVVWVSRQEQHSAEIRINPPDLGPVELRVTLDAQSGGQQAVVHFASPHAEVRDALLNALPQLRTSLADAGIALGNATVGSESFRDPSAGAQSGAAGNRAAAVEAPGDRATATASPTRRGNGLVDLFA